MVQRWVFSDPVGVTTWTVPLNPKDMSFPTNRRTLDALPAAAGEAGTLMASPMPVEISFGGQLLDQTHHDTLRSWVAISNPVNITDHLNRTWLLLLTSFEMTPRTVHGKGWYRGTYTIKGSALQ